jgi:hypothetical protein
MCLPLCTIKLADAVSIDKGCVMPSANGDAKPFCMSLVAISVNFETTPFCLALKEMLPPTGFGADGMPK